MNTKNRMGNALHEDEIMDFSALHENGGVAIREIIVQALRLPESWIEKTEFLRETLFRNRSDLHERTEIHAKELDALADRVIDVEERSLLSLEKVDMATYYARLIRTSLKLLYAYGFPEVNLGQKGEEFAPETIALLTLLLGAGYGINSAKYALDIVLRAYKSNVKEKVIATSLLKGGLAPYVNKTELLFEFYTSEKVFEMKNSYFSEIFFKSCCKRFRSCLRSAVFGVSEE